MDDNLKNGGQYFLARIREFEKTYRMESWNFLVLYQNQREALPGYNGRAAVDYSEWAFLCENVEEPFCESPPGVVCDMDEQKPEGLSGFCFSGGRFDYHAASLSGPCCEHSLG